MNDKEIQKKQRGTQKKHKGVNGKLVIGILTLLFFLGGAVSGQEIVTDEDSLFGDDDTTEISSDEDILFGSEDDMFSDGSNLIEEVSDDGMEDLSTLLLTSDSGVEIGGSFFFDVTAGMGGINPEDLSSSDLTESLSLDLGAALYLDARPDEDTRVFAKADISSPFYTIGGGGSD
ncbi:MAG: hypothetical protein U9N32_01665, partial [Spirochaetota bacterium]|nr:hypothetical protein [Spirochaetota bacterium]